MEGGDQSGKLCHEQQDTILTPLDTVTLYRMTHYIILLLIQGDTYSALLIQGDTYSALNIG